MNNEKFSLTFNTQSDFADLLVSSEEQQAKLSEWPGFKIVGDNIDKNFHPSFQCYSNKTNSIHAFHMYVVQDRVDFSSFSDIKPVCKVDESKLLITETDIDKFESDIVVLVSRFVHM